LFVYGTAGPNNTSINGTSGNCTINDTSQPAASVDSSFTIVGGNSFSTATFAQVQAHIHYKISHESGNSRIKIESWRGSSTAASTLTTDYVNYAGLNNITDLDVKYNVSSQTCVGTCGSTFKAPTPPGEGQNVNTYYALPEEIWWMAEADGTGVSPQNNSTATTASDVTLTVRIIDSVAGTFTATSNSVNINLNASYGSQPQV